MLNPSHHCDLKAEVLARTLRACAYFGGQGEQCAGSARRILSLYPRYLCLSECSLPPRTRSRRIWFRAAHP